MRFILKDGRENDSMKELMGHSFYEPRTIAFGISFYWHVPFPVDFNNRYYELKLSILCWKFVLILRW